MARMTITLEQAAKEYVDTLNGQSNGLGQHVHPTYGRSDYMMRAMWETFGREAADAAIDAEFAKRKEK